MTCGRLGAKPSSTAALAWASIRDCPLDANRRVRWIRYPEAATAARSLAMRALNL
jgi:hypothetical protein